MQKLHNLASSSVLAGLIYVHIWGTQVCQEGKEENTWFGLEVLAKGKHERSYGTSGCGERA